MLSQHAFQHRRSSFLTERRIFLVLAFGISAATISRRFPFRPISDIFDGFSNIASSSNTVVFSRLKKIAVC